MQKQGIIDVLSQFYSVHYNFGIIAAFLLLLAAFLGAKKENIKGVIVVLCVFVVYNLVMYNKARKDPEWYQKKEAEVKSFDPVKKLWEEKPADDNIDKRK